MSTALLRDAKLHLRSSWALASVSGDGRLKDRIAESGVAYWLNGLRGAEWRSQVDADVREWVKDQRNEPGGEKYGSIWITIAITIGIKLLEWWLNNYFNQSRSANMTVTKAQIATVCQQAAQGLAMLSIITTFTSVKWDDNALAAMKRICVLAGQDDELHQHVADLINNVSKSASDTPLPDAHDDVLVVRAAFAATAA